MDTQRLQQAADLCNNGQYAEAEPICRDLVRRYPVDARAHRTLGVILRNTEHFEESIEALETAIRLHPNEPAFYFELGSTFKVAEQLEESLKCFIKAVEMKPDFWQAISNVSGILGDVGRFEESKQWAVQGVRVDPDNVLCNYNLGNAQLGLGQVDAALRSYQRTLDADPDEARAHWNMSLCHLLNGNFREGWEKHEWRIQAGQVNVDQYDYPHWQGGPLDGKTLLVHAEQGIGDEILFSSCYPELIDRVGELVLTCDPRLEPLFIRSFPNAMIYGVPRKKDFDPDPLNEKIDYQIPAGSVPRFFRNEWSDFPDRRSYLVDDKKKTALWKERFEALGPGIKIGISWRTGGLPAARRIRVTSLTQWGHLFSMPGVHWVNLQYGNVQEELDAERERSGTIIHDWEDGDPLTDLDGFASRLCALDLVISVGNATAHMAGALGVESWVLLPQPPTWRWLLEGEQNPWYPSLLTLRQSKRGDWTPVFQQVGEMLAMRLGLAAEPSPVELHETSAPDLTFMGPDGMPLTAERVPAYIIEADEHVKAGRLREAEDILELVQNHFPKHFYAEQVKASVAMKRDRPDEAIRCLLRSLQYDPNDALVNFNLGNAYRAARRRKEACEHYIRAIQIKPDFAEAYLNIGVLYLDIKDKQRARAAYLKALEVNPDLEAAKTNLAQLDQPVARPQLPTDASQAAGAPTASSIPTAANDPPQPS